MHNLCSEPVLLCVQSTSGGTLVVDEEEACDDVVWVRTDPNVSIFLQILCDNCSEKETNKVKIWSHALTGEKLFKKFIYNREERIS